MKRLLSLLILVSTNAIAQELVFNGVEKDKDPGMITMQSNGEILLLITPDGRIIFNHEKFKHYQPGDFAARFIKILEDMRLPKCSPNPCSCLVNPINLDLGDSAESEKRWLEQLQRISEFRKACFAECKKMRDEK